jgi:Tetratricopeptide repeat
LAIIETLIDQHSEDQGLIRQRGRLLADLGDILSDQGRYSQAKQVYEEAFKITEQQSDLGAQSVVIAQLGELERQQGNYTQARLRYSRALEIDRVLANPADIAIDLHQLGTIAQDQEDWAEAERYYRESLTIKEQLGDAALAATTCNQLAIVARRSDRPDEAEGWYKRALELIEKVNPGGSDHANYLNNLSYLLVNEVQRGNAEQGRLAEARSNAEKALAIKEKLDASSEIWKTLSILADIAALEGRTEEAQVYRRRERETFAAFEGNRYHIDQQHGQLIAAIVAASKGDTQARANVEAALPDAEKNGWRITDATQRIWAGERDWHSLVEGIDSNSALLILRVLETIAEPEEIQG